MIGLSSVKLIKKMKQDKYNFQYLELEECQIGSIYKLHSRNLILGVFDPKNCFIGIRQKFNDLFLDHELHWDKGGTAMPLEKIGEVPSGMSLQISLGSFDITTKRDVFFDKPISDGGKGWCFLDSGEPSTDIRPCIKSNKELFLYLKDMERER